MATVNVIRSNPDKFYRYKMPVMNTKIEGRGNGIKTVIPNIEDVARALARPPTYPTKFFGCELGAQTTMAEDRYIVNGAHTQERLLELLDAFIVKFVLCGACDNPETELIITGKGRNEAIHRDCKACGRSTKIDMKHKLTTYILKNPPAKKGSKGKKGMTAEANVGGPMVIDAEEDGETSPTEAPDMGVPTKGTDIDDALGRGTDPVLDNPDEAEEVSKKLSALAVNGDDDDEEDGDSPYATLGAWLAENRDASDADIIDQIKENDIVGKHKVLIEIGSNLFTENVGAEIPKRAHLLSALVIGEKCQKSLLGGIERLIANSPNMESLIAGGITSKAMMALYQADLLDEELAKQWGTHASKKYVDKDKSKKIRKGSDAFLKWLDEADDESEEESDEE